MFGKNLKYYRLKKNISMKALAEACGVTPMAISNYESGKRRPDMDTINKLAEILGVHVVDFIASRNSSLEFNHCEFRKNSKLSKTKQEYIREAVEEYFGRFFDVVECLGGDPLPGPQQCHVLMRSGDIETDAKTLRSHLGLNESGPIYDLIGILENKGILVLELDIDDDHFSGINGTVNKYPYIAINTNMRAERKRTTTLHELAHLMFVWNPETEKENEQVATAIAGAVLISQNDIIRELGQRKTALTRDLSLVCEEYGISMYLLVKRAAYTGVISSALEKSFYIKANKINYRNTEPSRIRKEEKPQLLNQLVYRAVNEENVSLQRGAELLKIPVDQMQKYCGLEV